MAPGKLRMKRTPEEQAAHDVRKTSKAARKAAKKARRSRSRSPSSRDKRRRTDNSNYVFEWEEEQFVSNHSTTSSGEHSSHRQPKPDWDYVHAQVEEERFRDKLWGALEDDERLDGVEARMNSYAHIPRRWRGGGMDRMEDDMTIDPQFMEDEDYAEWVRLGMWR